MKLIAKKSNFSDFFDYDYDWVSHIFLDDYDYDYDYFWKFFARLRLRLRLERGNRLGNRQSNRDDYTSLTASMWEYIDVSLMK